MTNKKTQIFFIIAIILICLCILPILGLTYYYGGLYLKYNFKRLFYNMVVPWSFLKGHKNRPFMEGFEPERRKTDDWIVLLTTAVNGDPERIELYERQLKRWLENTRFPIFVVESSGYHFDAFNDYKKKGRLFVHSFTFDEKYDLVRNPSDRSLLEAKSMLKMVNFMEPLEVYKNCKYILKVTGRYFLEGIEQELEEKTNDGTDFYLQIHRRDKGGGEMYQNSEYFGLKKEHLKTLSNNVIQNYKKPKRDLMEHNLFYVSNDKQFTTLGPFDNKVARGGDSLVIEKL